VLSRAVVPEHQPCSCAIEFAPGTPVFSPGAQAWRTNPGHASARQQPIAVVHLSKWRSGCECLVGREDLLASLGLRPHHRCSNRWVLRRSLICRRAACTGSEDNRGIVNRTQAVDLCLTAAAVLSCAATMFTKIVSPPTSGIHRIEDGAHRGSDRRTVSDVITGSRCPHSCRLNEGDEFRDDRDDG